MIQSFNFIYTPWCSDAIIIIMNNEVEMKRPYEKHVQINVTFEWR
jgi:hypothetical protein